MTAFRHSDPGSTDFRDVGEADTPPTENGPSLFRPGKNCRQVVQADRVGLIVDGDEYFTAFAEAAQSAQHSILIVAWDFDSRVVLTLGPDGRSPISLGHLLNRLVKRRPDLRVHILIWDYPMIYAWDRELPPIYGLGWNPARHVHIRYDSTMPVGAAHHQKVIVIDDRLAFSGGLDLTNKRWDTCRHLSSEPRRTAKGKPYPPFHDTMMAVTGEAAKALGDLARSRWLAATGETLKPPPAAASREKLSADTLGSARLDAPRRGWRHRWFRRATASSPDSWPATLEPAFTNVPVAISLTEPAKNDRPAVTEVEELYLDMIRSARRCIYIENQYFTAHRLGEALAARLREPDGPEVVVIVRLLSHGWLEGLSMEGLRTRLILELREADQHGRFEVFYPAVGGLPEDQCLDVHSKLMIVDDEVLRIGSANFANRSMVLDTECDLTIEAQGDPTRASAIAGFRARLVAEHLGEPSDVVLAAERQHGSLIAAIRSLAREAGTLETDQRTLQVLEVVRDESERFGGLAKVADPEELVPLDRLIDELQPELGDEGAGPAWFRLTAIVLGLAALGALWRWTPLHNISNAGEITRLAQEAGQWPWAIPIVLAGYTLAAFLMFPRPLLTLFAVLTFGPWIGFLLAMSGILAATVATFLIGKRMDRQTVRKLAGRNLNRITELIRRRGVLAMIVLRLLPLAPFAVAGIMAGALHLRLRDLLAGTAVGVLPGTLLTTVLGGQVAAILGDPQPIDYVVLALVAILMVLMLLVARRMVRRLQLPVR